MALRTFGPATDTAVKAQLKISDDRDDAIVLLAVKAVNAYLRGRVRSVKVADVDVPEGEDPAIYAWPSDLELGGVMLGARIVRRRNSPDGVQDLTADGVAYVARSDPDISLLLGLGPYSKPVAR